MTKICTDIKQSKKLIKLGIDVSTSDCSWILHPVDGHYILSLTEPLEDDIPCWSLAALLSVLPSVIKRKGKRMFLTLEKAGAYNLYYKSPDRLDELWETKEEPIDACVAMIEKLHKQKLL